MSSSIDHHGVYAVPPVARRTDAERSIHPEENLRMLRHLAAGGVRRVLYGGNGNLYHMTLREYEALLECLSSASDDLTIIPSVGPAFGRAIEQAAVLRRYDFPFAMALPGSHPRTAPGLFAGYREIAEAAGIPLLLYLKDEENFGADLEAGLDVVATMIEDGVSVGVKYAVVRANPSEDAYLRSLLDRVDAEYVISGIGERPAIVHMEEWGLPGFTTGSGCVNPARTQALYEACARRDFDAAAEHRAVFMPLEDLRDAWGPPRVLHEAVDAAGIAAVGPHVPFLAPLTPDQHEAVAQAARDLVDVAVSA